VNVVIEVLGWTGAVVVLSAYLLAARDVWPASSARSAVANIAGAALLTVNAWWHGAFPSASVNVVWLVIGGATLLRVAGAAPRQAPGR
jgi:hypothetical protein